MRYRPWPIIILALTQLVSPLLNILFNSSLLHTDISIYLRSLANPGRALNTAMLFGVPLLNALFIFVCKMWGLVGFLVVQFLLMFWNLWQSMLFPGNYPIWIFLFATTANMLLVSYFLVPEVRRVYTDPRLRWWEAKPRYIYKTAVEIELAGAKHEGTTINVSEGGAFVQTQAPLKSGDELVLNVHEKGHEFAVSALVVHAQDSSGCYGLKYLASTKDSQRAQKTFIENVRAQGAKERTPREHWKKTFRQWIADFRTPRKALLPYIPEEVIERSKAS